MFRARFLFTAAIGVIAFSSGLRADEAPPLAAGPGTTIDFLEFFDCFSGPFAAIPTGCTTSNFRPDTHIDLADFAVVQRGYLLTPGAIQPAVETAGQIDPLDDVDEHTFQGVFGTTVTVDFVTPLVNNRPDLVVRMDLVRPNGTTAATTASCGTTSRLDTIPVDATGTWKVRVRAYESWSNCGFGPDPDLRTGVYTLSVCLSNAAPIPIDYGETHTGVYMSDGHIINYVFGGTVGDAVSVMYLGPAATRRVRIYAPNGILLASSGGGAGTAITDILLPLDGAYIITVEAADGLATFTYTIGLSELGDAVPIAFNSVQAGSLNQVAQVGTFSFDGVFGTTVTADFMTPMVGGRPDLVVRLDLIRPNGTTAASTATCGTTARLDTIPIDATGTWVVRVRAYESWFNCGYGPDTSLITGSYSLVVCPSNATPIPIAYGETKSAAFDVDCQIVNFEFDGAAGDIASIMYLGPAHTRRVRLYAANGSLLATSGGGQGTSLTDMLLPLDGMYRIAVEAADQQPVGNFSIGLSRLDAATPITLATLTSGSLDATADVDAFSFFGTFGTTVTVDYATTVVGNKPDIVVRIDLIRPSGTVAASTATCGANVRLDTIPLDASGLWTVRVRSYESWFNCGFGPDTELLTGGFNIAVATSDAPPTPIAYGQTRDGAFQVDCEVVNFQFDGSLGDIATVVYFGSAVARRVQLFAPNGSLLATSGGGQGTSINDVLLPSTGLYRVAVEAADNQPVGNFSIGLARLGASVPIILDTSTPASLVQIGETDTFGFDGLFGSTVNVDYSTTVVGSQPDIVARIELIRPNGSQASSTATCGGNARLDTVPLDATGTWTVRIRAYESWFNCGFGPNTALLTGNYTVAVSTSDGPATSISYGQTRNGNLVVDSQIVNYQFAGTLGDAATAVYYGPAYVRRLLLFAPNGSLLGTSGGGLGTALQDVLLPLNGTYRLAVEAADNQPTGAFSIGISELGDAVTIPLDTTTAGVINLPGEVRLYAFDRTAGNVVSIRFETVVTSGKPDLPVRMELVRPDGTPATGTASCGGTATLNNVNLDQTGTWTLRVRAYESWSSCGFGTDTALLTGAYTVRVCVGTCP